MMSTVMARCKKAGTFGIPTATRSVAVGSRMPHIAPNLGAAPSIAIAHPARGKLPPNFFLDVV